MGPIGRRVTNAEGHSLIAVGTGFATSFFLDEYLRHAPGDARVLVLERGRHVTHAERLTRRFEPDADIQDSFENTSPIDKQWYFSFGFGGSSQCWWAATPRMMPNDFRLRSLYGVGADWPVDYDALEPYYGEAEQRMGVSGANGDAPYPRSRPYPEPPHRFSEPDAMLKRAWPRAFFHQPTARPRTASQGRPACCNNGVCGLCPIDSKFTVLNGMASVYRDPRVELRLGSTALRLETRADVVTGVVYERDGVEYTASADQVALGANAIFNPFLMLRSGIEGPELGKGLVEQVALHARIDLDGLENFQGSTSITGNGYTAYDGPHRGTRAAMLTETWNVPDLRNQRGRWRQRLFVKLIFEDLRQARNEVGISKQDPTRPAVYYESHSDYASRGLAAAPTLLEEFVAPLPVESIHLETRPVKTEAHIIGTHVMGSDAATSVVDDRWTHHRFRNLQVMGSGTFPTAAPANPTLTLSALALRSARLLYGASC